MQRNELLNEKELMRLEIIDAGMKVQRKVRRQRQVRRQRFMLGVIGIIVLSGIFVSVAAKFQKAEGENTKSTGIFQLFSREKQGSLMIDETSWNPLILVNKSQALPEDYKVELHWMENGVVSVSAEIYQPLQDMLADGEEQGMEFVVVSGYRSKEYQERIIEDDIELLMRDGLSYEEAYEKETREIVPPGHSEHETGLAVDIVSSGYQVLDEKQEHTDENQWLQENCSKYGFILRYPRNGEKITGTEYQPWHYRYVGVEAAADMAGRRVTLEEYLESIDQ